MEKLINTFLWDLNNKKYPEFDKESKRLTGLINKHLEDINCTCCSAYKK